MTADEKELRLSLLALGLSDQVISAAWPDWWSDSAASSASARAELRFSLSRKLGLDPRSLFGSDAPRFVWYDQAKFKNLTTESAKQQAAITSFGMSVGRGLAQAAQKAVHSSIPSAKELRESILVNQPFIRLIDLLGAAWALGVPIIHLRVFPLAAKKMAAMAVKITGRPVILLGQDSDYPAKIAYYIAHELGHISHGHANDVNAIVDLNDPLLNRTDDQEEKIADEYALELLTGNPKTSVSTETKKFTARQLAESVLKAAESLRVEPGTLALCFGHSTGRWSQVQSAMKIIYKTPQPVWEQVNRVASTQLDWESLSDDMGAYLVAVMGGIGREHIAG